MKEVVSGCHLIWCLTSTWAAQLLGDSAEDTSIRTRGQATVARGHLDYKYWRFVRTVWAFEFGWDTSLLAWKLSRDAWDVGCCRGVRATLCKRGASRGPPREADLPADTSILVLQQQGTFTFALAAGHRPRAGCPFSLVALWIKTYTLH